MPWKAPAPSGRSKLNCQKPCKGRPADADNRDATTRHSNNKNEKLLKGIWHRDAGARGWPDAQGGKDSRIPVPLFGTGKSGPPFHSLSQLSLSSIVAVRNY